MKNKLEGISLIVLVITIVVMTILATAVVLSLKDQNVINDSYELGFKNDITTFKEQLDLYIKDKKVSSISEGERYSEQKLNADSISATYSGQNITNVSNILDIISQMKKSKYSNSGQKFKVQNGELVYVESKVTSSDEIKWLADLSVKASNEE
ncbi:hypothetical protein D3C76_1069590 [compost metagenome]